MLRRGLSAAVGASLVMLTISLARAEGPTAWRLHGTLDGEARPLLCKDPETANLVVDVLGRALEAKAGGDADKAKGLFEVAAKLESEICLKPAADDIVILRCRLGDKSFGDTRISLAKISALLKSNSSAGEQPFYAWTYATIEPAADGANAGDADKKWCSGEETAADAPLEPTPDLIQRVQQRFYDFGFGIKEIDGRLNNETVQGLVAFQKWAGLPETGQFTKLTLQKIDTTEAPPAWAALVFDGLGNHSMVTGDTRRAAESDAVELFRKKWRSDYNVASVPVPHCIAISTTRYKTRRRTFTQAFTSMGDSAGDANQNSLDYCNREKGGGTCQARDAICAAGGNAPPPRYDRGNISINAAPPQSGGKPLRYDNEAIPANSPAPDSGQYKRIEPENLPVNAQAPGMSSGAEEDDDKSAPVPPEPDKPPEQVQAPAEKAPSP
jgi:peptidoglycan hydrolase-like protein with peptidoglycan-binding domain